MSFFDSQHMLKLSHVFVQAVEAAIGYSGCSFAKTTGLHQQGLGFNGSSATDETNSARVIDPAVDSHSSLQLLQAQFVKPEAQPVNLKCETLISSESTGFATDAVTASCGKELTLDVK